MLTQFISIAFVVIGWELIKIQCHQSKSNLFGTSFCIRNRQVGHRRCSVYTGQIKHKIAYVYTGFRFIQGSV
jgi:hypothetical protein